MENENSNTNGNLFTITKPKSKSNDVVSETLVQVNSRSNIFKKQSFYKKASLCLLIFLLLFIVAFIVALYDYIKARQDVINLRHQDICITEECLRSAANLRLSMDTRLDPCEDFYQFTCGRWSQEHPNHGWYPHFSSFETVDERIISAVVKFLESNKSADEPLPVRQSRDLYLSCMDVDALDKLGYSVIVKYLKEVNLPLVPNFFGVNKQDNFTFDWIKTEIILKKTFAMDTFIGFIVDADIFNRSNSVIYMGAPGSDCPLPSALKRQNNLIWNAKTLRKQKTTDDDEQARGNLEAKEVAYKNIVKQVINVVVFNSTGLSLEKDVLEEAASTIWNITQDLEEISGENDTNFSLEFYRIKVDDLQNLTDQVLLQNNESTVLIWRRYLELMFLGVPNVTLDLNNTDFIYIPEEEMVYLSEIVLYVSKIPDVVLELYMWWVTVYAMIMNTTSEIADFIAKETAVINRMNVYRSRSIDCASLVINFMGLAVSYGVADQTFLTKTKPKV